MAYRYLSIYSISKARQQVMHGEVLQGLFPSILRVRKRRKTCPLNKNLCHLTSFGERRKAKIFQEKTLNATRLFLFNANLRDQSKPFKYVPESSFVQ